MIFLYTIGHSNHKFEKLAQLLKDNRITTLVDVRSAPYSRYTPHFNKDDLEFNLPRQEIEYIYEGKHLGGRPSDPSCYKNRKLPEEGADFLHEVDYPEMMKRPWFTKTVDRLLEIAEARPTAILCAEEDPVDCHRHHLISKYLMGVFAADEVEIRHIRGDGTVYSARSIHVSVDDPPEKQLPLF